MHIVSSVRWTLAYAFQGLVDLDLEIAKCEKKLNLARINLAKTVKLIEGAADTVPESVRSSNEEKVRGSPCSCANASDLNIPLIAQDVGG